MWFLLLFVPRNFYTGCLSLLFSAYRDWCSKMLCCIILQANFFWTQVFQILYCRELFVILVQFSWRMELWSVAFHTANGNSYWQWVQMILYTVSCDISLHLLLSIIWHFSHSDFCFQHCEIDWARENITVTDLFLLLRLYKC